jgi:hypothetical protein
MRGPREFGRIAGGLVMEPIFRRTDLAQAIAGGLAMVTVLAQLVAFPQRWPLARVATWLRPVLRGRRCAAGRLARRGGWRRE